MLTYRLAARNLFLSLIFLKSKESVFGWEFCYSKHRTRRVGCRSNTVCANFYTTEK